MGLERGIDEKWKRHVSFVIGDFHLLIVFSSVILQGIVATKYNKKDSNLCIIRQYDAAKDSNPNQASRALKQVCQFIKYFWILW